MRHAPTFIDIPDKDRISSFIVLCYSTDHALSRLPMVSLALRKGGEAQKRTLQGIGSHAQAFHLALAEINELHETMILYKNSFAVTASKLLYHDFVEKKIISALKESYEINRVVIAPGFIQNSPR